MVISKPAQLAACMALIAPSMLYAQSAPDLQKIEGSLRNGRVQSVSGSAVDASKAGYIRIRVQPIAFDRNALCPRDDQERSQLKRLEASIWSWALKDKQNWSATAQIVYDGARANFADPTFKPDVELKFFSVVQPGSKAKDCQVENSDIRIFESPLVRLETGMGSPQSVAIQFSVFYNKQVDQARINNITTTGAALLGLVGIPVGLLEKVRPTATNEVKAILDKERHSSVLTSVRPFDSTAVGALALLGLREPSSTDYANEPRALVSLVPVSSMFSQDKPTYSDLSQLSPQNILDFEVRKGPSVFLSAYLNTSPSYQSMLTAPDPVTMSAHCETLDGFMRNDLRFSPIDAAVVLRAIAARNPIVGAKSNVTCLSNRLDLLKTVGLSLVDDKRKDIAADKSRMDEAMRTVAQIRSTATDNLTLAQTSIFKYPVRIVDPTNRFGWEGQARTFTDQQQVDLAGFLSSQSTNIGCWAYFENLPVDFALGLDGAAAGTGSLVRKSAALVRMTNGDVMVLQFRYEPDNGPSKISGLAFATADSAAKSQMRQNDDCKKPDRDWMKPYLGL